MNIYNRNILNTIRFYGVSLFKSEREMNGYIIIYLYIPNT